MLQKTALTKLEPSNPSADWTLEHALLILVNQSKDDIIIKSLEIFLTANKSLLLSECLPFSKLSSSKQIHGEKFDLLSVTQENTLSKTYQGYAIEIADLLKLDLQEVVRIISTTNNRIPDEQSLKLEDDSNRTWLKDSEKNEILFLFASRVMKERRTVLKIIFQLLKSSHIESPKLLSITNEIKDRSYKLIESCIHNITTIVEELNQLQDHPLDQLIKHEHGLLILDILNLLSCLILKSDTGFTKATVTKWFKLIEETSYLSSLSSKIAPSSAEQMNTIECLSTIISLTLLDLDFNFGSLSEEATFMNDPEDLHTITSCLFNCGSNSIVLYAWSIILHRKYITIQEDPNNKISLQIVERFEGLDKLQSTFLSCAKEAEKLDVCAALLKCNRILSYDSIYSAILGSFVIAFVPYIQLSDPMSSAIQTILDNSPDQIVRRFFMNPGAEDLLAIARAKLPLSLKSFIRLVSINPNLAIEELSSVRTYMEVFKDDEFYFKYRIDDENPDLIRLTQDVDILPPYESNGELSLLLKEGTKGQIIPGTSPAENTIVAFLYDYNGFSLLGRILKNISKKFDNDKEKLELVIDIFNLLTKIAADADEETLVEILTAMSTFIEEDSIIDVVFRILDQGLHSRCVPLLESSMNLLGALTTSGYSFRVWSYLYKSHLLGFKASGGLASTILGAVEMVDWEFDFTLSLLQLTKLLIGDCITLDEKVSTKLKSEVIEKLVAQTIQIFENFVHWRYNKDYQKLQIGSYVVDIFSSILSLVYGIDENAEPEHKVTKVFAAASKKITTSFLVPDIQISRSTRPIIAAIDLLSSSHFDYNSSELAGFWHNNWIHSVFEFSASLISVRAQFQGATPSTFEMNLYSKLPNLVDIYSTNLDLRKDIIRLLSKLVNAKWDTEPPSLLTHLAQRHTQILLHCLATDMSNNFEDFDMKVALYDFFAAVMDGNQEGLSIVFITGRDIKEWLLDDKKSLSVEEKGKKSKHSLLKILKKNVSMIQHYPNNVALHLADALAMAFNSWTTAKEEGDDQEFINMMISELQDFPEVPEMDFGNHEAIINYCYQVRLLSKIAEILSLYLFVSQNKACKEKIFNMMNSSEFYSKLDARFKIVGYQPSIHENLNKNFESAWPNFKISQFTRSSVYKKNRYGVDSIYAFNLMDSLFENEGKWPEFREEILLTSMNLQFTSAQITTAKSFGALVTSFCKINGPSLNPQYLNIASALLKINDQEGIPSSLFSTIYQERVELAFMVCLVFSKIPDAKCDDKVVFSIISSTCQILMSREIDLNAGLLGMDHIYYKALLRTLLISLQLIHKDTMLLVEYSATFGDIFSSIISKSIKTLFGSIQNQGVSYPNKDFGTSPLVAKQIDDISLILLILKTFLSLKLSRNLEASIAKSMNNSGTFKSIMNLYSCSHLIKVSNEEVFAEYSLMFINELVAVKPFAETLTSNGLFSVLIDSPISLRIQKGNVSSISQSKSNLHHLWINGLLSIIITLIANFGEKILPEICIFVVAFQRQFQYTINGWLDSNITISTPAIQETSQIILLVKALHVLDAYDFIKNATPHLEKVVLVPGLDTKEERVNFVNGLNYLITHPKFLSLRVVPTNPEEQRMLESPGEKAKFVDSLLDEIRDLKESLLD